MKEESEKLIQEVEKKFQKSDVETKKLLLAQEKSLKEALDKLIEAEKQHQAEKKQLQVEK
jgi:hypothetical protein